MKFSDGKEKFDIVEVEVFEEDQDASTAAGYDPEAPVNIPHTKQQEDRVTRTREEMRQRRRDRQRRREPKAKKYNWGKPDLPAMVKLNFNIIELKIKMF